MFITVDFETFYDKDLTVVGACPESYCLEGVRQGRFNVLLVSAADETDAWAGPPSEFDWSRLDRPSAEFVFHNARFDLAVWHTAHQLGIIPVPPPPADRVQCSADMTAFFTSGAYRNLAGAAKEFLGVEVSKDPRSKAKGKTLAEMTEEERKTFLEYAKNDARLTYNLWVKLHQKWPQKERELARLTRKQGQYGLCIDKELLAKYLTLVALAKSKVEGLIPWSKENAPTSPKAFAECCRKVGIPPPPVKTKNPTDFTAWETAYAKQHPFIVAVSAWRKLSKLLASLEQIRQRTFDDGGLPVFHIGLKYFGAHTGRWSGEAGFNIQNIRKEALSIREDGTPVLPVSVFESSAPEVSVDVRRLFVASPGHRLVIADLAQIEPRVLAWLSGDFELLDTLRQGQSLYEAHARKTMGWKGGKLKEEDPKLYALAKARVLGLGYGCGWKKFIDVAKILAGLDLTEDDPEKETYVDAYTGEVCERDGYGATARRIVKDFRESNPKILALWRRLEQGLKNSVGGDFIVELPSWRSLTYKNVRQVEYRTEDGGLRTSLWAVAGGRLQEFFGGKLTENLVQATARDVFGEILLRLDKAGIQSLFSVHDEVVLDVPDSVPLDYVRDLMVSPIDWMPELPIEIEATESRHYKK